jgi:hypothetical protein
VNFAAITLYVASQRVFIVASIYFVIDSVRKLLDTLVLCRIYANRLLIREVEELARKRIQVALWC